MSYEEMLEILWKHRYEKKYDIENEESDLGYAFHYGFIGCVSFEDSSVYYVDNENDLEFPLPLFLLKSKKWQLKNARDLDPDSLFFKSGEDDENRFRF